MSTITKEVEQIINRVDDTGADDYYRQHVAVDTAGFLRHLCEQATAVSTLEFGSEEEAIDEMFGGKNYKCDNTYNYNEPYAHSMAVLMQEIRDEGEPFVVAYAPHVSGDIRVNYEDYVVFKFNSYFDFVDACNDYYSEHALSIEIDGKTYTLTYGGSGEYYILDRNGEFVSDTFMPEPWTRKDLEKSIKRRIEELEV